MKHLWHKIIVWYLRHCWGAFHCYPYGEGGKYVVLMSDADYHTYKNYSELTERVTWWQQRTKDVSATNDRLKAENAWLRQHLAQERAVQQAHEADTATWESLGRGFIEVEPDQTYGAAD